jgi:hypothetical protein
MSGFIWKPSMEPQSSRVHHRKATGRPVVKNRRRNGPPQHRRLYFSYAKQLHVINWRKEHSMESALDTFFCGTQGIARISATKRVLRWEQNRKDITNKANNPATACLMNTRAQGTATPLAKKDEELIATWVHDLRCEGIPVGKMS